MPGTLSQLDDELHQAIAHVWPEVVAATADPDLIRGIYSAEPAEVVLMDVQEFPYAVLNIQDYSKGDWAQDRTSYEFSAEILYVVKSAGSAKPVKDKLEALAAYLLPTAPQVDPLVYGQVLEVTPITTGRKLPMNRMFRSQKMKAQAGSVTFRILVEP